MEFLALDNLSTINLKFEIDMMFLMKEVTLYSVFGDFLLIMRLYKDAHFKIGPVMTTKNPICIMVCYYYYT